MIGIIPLNAGTPTSSNFIVFLSLWTDFANPFFKANK